MALPSQAIALPGKEQEPETCTNPRSIMHKGWSCIDRCGEDLARCEGCHIVACPHCKGWKGDAEYCPKCKSPEDRITELQLTLQAVKHHIRIATVRPLAAGPTIELAKAREQIERALG